MPGPIPPAFLNTMITKGADIVVSRTVYPPPALINFAKLASLNGTRVIIRDAKLLTAAQFNAIIAAGPHHVVFDVT
jgi:hypothetical protein